MKHEPSKEQVLDALQTHKTVQKAAKALGLSYPKMQHWLKKYGIVCNHNAKQVEPEPIAPTCLGINDFSRKESKMNTVEEIYPLTVVCDRYGGTYSGGRYTAWNCDPWDVPEEIDESDVPCSMFWDSYIGLVGKGATPLQAMEDLRIKLNEDLEKRKGE